MYIAQPPTFPPPTAILYQPNILLSSFYVDFSLWNCYRQQKALFDSIKPLFNNKPLIVVANKSDVLARTELTEEKEIIYKEIEKEIGRDILEMSTVTEVGVMDVKVRIVGLWHCFIDRISVKIQLLWLKFDLFEDLVSDL